RAAPQDDPARAGEPFAQRRGDPPARPAAGRARSRDPPAAQEPQLRGTCAVILAGLLGVLPAAAEDVRGALARYRQARAAPPGIVVPPAWLAERLARGDRLQVIDARAATAQRTPPKGAMVRP